MSDLGLSSSTIGVVLAAVTGSGRPPGIVSVRETAAGVVPLAAVATLSAAALLRLPRRSGLWIRQITNM